MELMLLSNSLVKYFIVKPRNQLQDRLRFVYFKNFVLGRVVLIESNFFCFVADEKFWNQHFEEIESPLLQDDFLSGGFMIRKEKVPQDNKFFINSKSVENFHDFDNLLNVFDSYRALPPVNFRTSKNFCDWRLIIKKSIKFCFIELFDKFSLILTIGKKVWIWLWS